MTNLFDKIEARRVRKEQRALERWQQIKSRGKLRFVTQTAATWGLTLAGLFDVFTYLVQGSHSLSLSEVCLYLLLGMSFAVGGWASMEDKYKKALDKEPKAPPDSRLRITP